MTTAMYDPYEPPDASEWLTMGEEARIAMVRVYHQSIGDVGDSEQLHALFHVIVENQIAMGAHMEPVRERLRQLMAQGLDRHDAVHAIGYVLAKHMHWLALDRNAGASQDARYFRELKRMTARKYLGVARGVVIDQSARRPT
jgi:hypothetical protein